LNDGEEQNPLSKIVEIRAGGANDERAVARSYGGNCKTISS
jgi:hypothetical protein